MFTECQEAVLNVTDKPRSFEALYLRPNDGGGGHFVYNINTKQRNSVPRVIGEEGKGIPMTDAIIKTISEQGSYENQPEGIIFGDMNNLTTILDLEPSAEGGEDPEFDDDDASDRSYTPKDDDDSTLSGDHDLPMHHMEDNPDGYYEDPGVDGEDHEDPGVDGGEADNNAHAKEEDPLFEELHFVEDVVEEDEAEAVAEYVVEEVEEVEEEREQVEPEPEEESPAKKLSDNGLDGKYWTGYCLSVIKGYGNLEATLSTPQYGFKKGLTMFGESGYDATVKELDENLIGRDVIQMIDPKSVTYDMFQMSLSYLMFLKRKRCGKIKA
jgi:hypothetical protein